jgi:hypothetical protein
VVNRQMVLVQYINVAPPMPLLIKNSWMRDIFPAQEREPSASYPLEGDEYNIRG